MTDFTNGKTTQPENSSEDKTNFQGNVNTEGNEDSNQDNGYVFELDGRKFTREDLEKKLRNADEFIDTLKQERAEDRKLLEEVQNTLKEQVSAKEVLKQVKEGQEKPAEVGETKPSVDADTVAAKVLEQLKQKQDLEQRDKNWDDVTSQLTSVFGDKTNAKVAEVARENDMTLAEAADLARNKPKMFLKLFPDLKPTPQKSALFQGSRNTQSFQSKPKGPSGFTSAKNTKDQVSVYLKRLQELGGN